MNLARKKVAAEVIVTDKEYLRKTIHILTVLVIPFAVLSSVRAAIAVLTVLAIGYTVAEYYRFKGEHVAFITYLVKACARERELRGFVLTPLYMLLSVIALLGLFALPAASVGIVAATLGDGMATIVGRLHGRHKLLFSKTIEGSFALFIFTFLGSLIFVDAPIAFAVSLAVMLTELVSGDYDNITVPFVAAILVSFL